MNTKNTFLDYDLSSHHSEIKSMMMQKFGWKDAVEYDGQILQLVNTKLWKEGEIDVSTARTQFLQCAEYYGVAKAWCIAAPTEFPNGAWAFIGRIEKAPPKQLLQPYMKQTSFRY